MSKAYTITVTDNETNETKTFDTNVLMLACEATEPCEDCGSDHDTYAVATRWREVPAVILAQLMNLLIDSVEVSLADSRTDSTTEGSVENEH